jgi:hypothetical protein
MAAHKDLCNLPNLTCPLFKKIELDNKIASAQVNNIQLFDTI